MPKLLVIADDFTGALDTAAQFSKRGIKAFMTTDLNIDLTDSLAEVLAVDAETRTIPPKEAYEKVYSLCARAKEAGIGMIYKKTDSTLRGNIGAEFEAAISALSLPLTFAPAYPQNGRTTRSAVQYINGVPIAESGLKDDPINPVKNSFIPDIIAETSSIGVVLEQIEPNLVCVFDAATEGDLDTIFERLRGARALGLTAGCAGFAEAFAKLGPFEKWPLAVPRRRGNILAVCGSVNAASMAQCRAARDAGLNVETLLGRELFTGGDAELEALSSRLEQRLASGFLLIHTDGDRTLPREAPEKIAVAMGTITSRLIKNGVSHLILFGGNTAVSIMERAGISGFSPLAEISPGVVFSEAENLSIITKAGGFGSEQIVLEILNYIKE